MGQLATGHVVSRAGPRRCRGGRRYDVFFFWYAANVFSLSK
jgi:hypothetical protein